MEVPPTPPYTPPVRLKNTHSENHTASPSLPSPSQVRQYAEQNSSPPAPNETLVAHFLNLKLRVKYGSLAVLQEGETMEMIRTQLRGRVPVPEVYACYEDGGQGFLYMEDIDGPTLQEEWPQMSTEEKKSVCLELHRIVKAMRELHQDPNKVFVGNIGHTPVTDVYLKYFPNRGPYSSVKSLHDIIAGRLKIAGEDPSKGFDPVRSELDDSSKIVFTHNDLHLSNIIVSPRIEGPPVIRAIIDWYQSGWYPDYWEYCKLATTANAQGGWDEQYVDRILEPPTSYDAWTFYMHCLGW